MHKAPDWKVKEIPLSISPDYFFHMESSSV
jgi:hypothetical protein